MLMHNTLAQLPEPYSGLPVDSLSSGFFLPLSGKLHIPPDGETPMIHDYGAVFGYIHALDHAEYPQGSFPAIGDFLAASQASKSNEAVVPMLLVDLAVNDLHPDAIDEGWLGQGDDGSFQVLNTSVNPFIEKRSFFFAVDWELHWDGSYTLMLDSSFFFSDASTAAYSIDFDDGIGFRPLEPGIPMTVSYEGGSDRLIRLKAESTEGERESAFLLKSGSCASGYPQPDLPPWPQVSYEFPWRIIAPWEDGEVRGNAYLLTSNDGVFDRPFIFVEGIDFGSERSALRNGSFGWAEFTCGATENYPFLALMPELLDALRDEGYDLILLDFEDGADHIAKNAAVLRALIDKVNTYKSGNEELVVSGASMGGQISRVALRQMELEGIDHCTRLWISLDSPHRGANVPFGLQTTIEFLANFNAEAEIFLNNFLRRPAAREMLLLQLPSSNSLHAQYQAYIDEIGYPEKTRNIGIANGSINGVSLGFADGAPLLDFECSVGPATLLKLLVLSTAGDPFNTNSLPSSNVISHTIYSQVIECSGLLDCILGPIWSLVSTEFFAYIPPNAPRLDNAPGGLRTSMTQFVTAMNTALEELAASGNYPGLCSSQILPNQYIDVHSFIPTTSALGIGSEWYHMNVAEALGSNPQLTPFDRVYGVAGANTLHSEITPEIIALVIEEVISGGASPGPILEGGMAFNYGVAPFHVCYDLEIGQGGQLGINAMAPLGFGENPLELPSPNSHCTVRTSDCGALVVIDAGGSMRLGDGSYGLTAELIIDEDSELHLNEGGELLVGANSTLRLREGGRIVLNGGELTLQPGARLVIETNGELLVEASSEIALHGVSTYIDLHGHIAIQSGCTLGLLMEGDEGGKLRVFSSDTNVFGTATSQLSVVGQGVHDAIVEVLPGAMLCSAPGFGALRFRDGRINLLADAKVVSAGPLFVRDTFISATGDGNKIDARNTTSFRSCTLENCDIIAELNTELLRLEDCTVKNGKLSISGGRYRVEECHFEDACVVGEAASNTNLVRSTVFNSSGLVAGAAIYDRSSYDLLCDDVTVEGYPIGIQRRGGELTLRCSTLSECGAGVEGESLSTLNLSGHTNAGYNTFIDNGVHIRLSLASELLLQNGGNTFGGFTDYVIRGTINGMCTSDCGYLINANGNNWPSLLGTIDASYFNVVVPDPNCGNDALGKPACVVNIIDKWPPAQYGCAQPGGPFTIRQKSAEIAHMEQAAASSIEQSTRFHIYPNPADELVVIQTFGPLDELPTFSLMQADGKLLEPPHSSGVQNGQFQINLNGLAAGCYLLNIRTNNHSEVHRILVR